MKEEKCKMAECISNCLKKKVEILGFLSPLVNLVIRLWMARIFWLSGLTKLESWSKTVGLFESEYKVPVISPSIAAFLATAVEITCPLLLVIGLGTRFSAVALLVMTGVIIHT